ncbi:MAG: HPr family phosphocarrier protein [Planctomycetota bacterium]|jgi:hypothetical protein
MAAKGDEDKLVQPPARATIAEEDFRELIARRAQRLLELTGYLSQPQPAEAGLTRPVLADLLSQATQLEEILDAYGAINNRRWCGIRSITAALKLFSGVGYVLLHIRHALPAYRLPPIEEDFVKATDEAVAFVGEILRRASRRMLAEAAGLGLPIPPQEYPAGAYEERLPEGRLPRDVDTRTIENARETVTHLATAYLSLAAESEPVHVAGRAEPDEYASCFPDPVSEERLRRLQDRFHNLQSLYDTYVSGTRTERLDPDLPVLRGHVSVIFHLLETATAFAHYYERHVNIPPGHSADRRGPPVEADELLAVLMDYSIAFTSRYLSSATQLCQGMLDRYAEVGRIEVPLPRYRGFHVRPATLVAKIVRHYGSKVCMELEGESYDAGSPLEIFRANEKINARKRRWLASEIARLGLVCEQGGVDAASMVNDVVSTLADQGKLVIYEQPLELSDEPQLKPETLLEHVIGQINRLQAAGKLDVRADLNVAFVGDKRVLADVKLLTESGYGEDDFGNNIELPKELAYLRR